MSWDAELKATITARQAISKGALAGDVKAMADIPATRITWVRSIQPLRLPSHGREKRSMTGDQKNFNVYGTPTREKRPIVRMSTPSTVSHACNVPLVKAKGSPEANPKGNMTANRLDARNWVKDLGSIIDYV